jgi:uncharacterized protein YkwD
MMRIGSCLALACGLGILFSLAQAGDGKKKPFEQTPDELKVFELINLERKKKDLPLLKINPALSKIARGHSENMARQGKMEHNLDNKTPFDRMRAAGYKFAKGGENIAEGDEIATLPMIVKAWMESPGHRDNILLAEFSETGVGLARDKDGKMFYTQLFARPRKE